MSDDRLKTPPERDFGFWQPRKHGKWREVPLPEPALEGPVADSHAHLDMLPDPAWELARCAANGVDFVCQMCNPADEGTRPVDEFDEWNAAAAAHLREAGLDCEIPQSCVAVGVHPHTASAFDSAMEARVLELLDSPVVCAVGEIGLDYFYDKSPREAQRDVFRRQVAMALERDLPIALHLRDAEDPTIGDAHAEAFELLRDMDALGPRTLLHCCALPPDEIAPWLEAGCYIAHGGAVTFKKNEAARDGVRSVPADRLLFETDAPFMAPEPMRGAACTPAHVVFTAAAIAEMRGIGPGSDRAAFLAQVHDNTLRFLGKDSR